MPSPSKMERPKVRHYEIEYGAELTPFTLPAQESQQVGSYA